MAQAAVLYSEESEIIREREQQSTRTFRPTSPADFGVTMDTSHIFDMLLYHMYSTFGGFLINVVGLTIIMIGGLRYFFHKMTLSMAIIYVVFGVLVLVSTPLSLWMRARNTMKLAKYQQPIHYSFDNDGIHETVQDGVNHYSWSQVEKAVNTPKTISFYMEGNGSVLVFPKRDFDTTTFQSAMWYLSRNVVMGKIYIH
ncbi:MAG: YcxB family protein [Clostridiales bacterium]|nr:YcxB family protein [Clostridiales bacterium]